MASSGFTQETLAFLSDLDANNDRDWFQANKARYQEHVVAPALAVIDGLQPYMAQLSPPHRAEARLNGSFRRLNRDVRFSKDKRPYAARIHLIFWTGEHPNRSPGVHFVLGADSFGYGCGNWVVDADQLAAYRQAVVGAGGAALEEALVQAASVGCRLGEADLKKLPKGIDASMPRAELTRYKGLVARTFEEDGPHPVPAQLLTGDWRGYLEQLAGQLAPLNAWLCRYVYT